MLKADALFIAVLNNAPSYFLIYKDLKALEMERVFVNLVLCFFLFTFV
jgi:hypothetical protein